MGKKLLETFSYDPKTGVIIRLKSRFKSKLGPLTKLNSYGYIRMTMDQKDYTAARFAFLSMGLSVPSNFVIDHINGNRADNRWCNLRLVTKRQNDQNKKCHRDGKLCGVSKLPNGKFWSHIRYNSKNIALGTYKTAEKAHDAYREMGMKLDSTDLMHLVLDKLESDCPYHQEAAKHIRKSIIHLWRKPEDRESRGVEGKNEL